MLQSRSLNRARTRRLRSGFTLVEMMVAMALSLGIMLILTEAFRISLDFIRGANSTGTMILQLNGAGNALKRDLEAEHFLPDDSRSNRGVRLSDIRFDLGAPRPTSGFFLIFSPSVAATSTDGEGFYIYPPTTNRVLHFTVILPGGTDQNVFTTTSGGRTYTSRAAEVAYFLVPTGLRTSATGQPLFNLIRRYRLVALTPDDQANLNIVAPPDTAASYAEVISTSNGSTANKLADFSANAATPPRLSRTAFPLGSNRYGEDILASNVLSFDVMANWDGAPASRPFGPANTDAPYDYFQNATGLFDTASSPPPTMRIRSLRVTLRLFDPNVKQTRQDTWEFAM